MSIPVKQTVPCPKCGAEIAFTMWQSINTETPNAVDDIISGRLFEVTCGKCGYKTYVNYPILFNDMDDQVMIFNTIPEQAEETEKAVESMRKTVPFRFRIVLDQSTLREKTAIFHAGLDDRVTEILKLIVTVQAREQLAGKEITGVYFVPGDEPRFEIVLGEEAAYVPVTTEMYDNIAKQYEKELAAEDGECYIDQEWAVAFLSEQGERRQQEDRPL